MESSVAVWIRQFAELYGYSFEHDEFRKGYFKRNAEFGVGFDYDEQSGGIAIECVFNIGSQYYKYGYLYTIPEDSYEWVERVLKSGLKEVVSKVFDEVLFDRSKK